MKHGKLKGNKRLAKTMPPGRLKKKKKKKRTADPAAAVLSAAAPVQTTAPAIAASKVAATTTCTTPLHQQALPKESAQLHGELDNIASIREDAASGSKKQQEAALKAQKAAPSEQEKSNESQDEAEGAAATAAQEVPRPALPPNIPYTTEDVILLVGEGNFSFSASLASILGSAEQLVATSYDTAEEVDRKYPDAQAHIELLTDLGGSVLHDVDATNLFATKALKGKAFSKIIFNFPHVGAGIKDQVHNIASNQQMLLSFFASSKAFLSSPSSGPVYTPQGPVTLPPGEVHVTLKKGLPYDDWGVPALAASAGFMTQNCFEFRPEWYPEYEHRRTIGFDATKAGNAELVTKTCRTWVFVVKPPPGRRGGGRHRGGGSSRGRSGGRFDRGRPNNTRGRGSKGSQASRGRGALKKQDGSKRRRQGSDDSGSD